MEQNTATPPKGGKAVRTILEWTEEIVLAVVLIAVVFTFVCRVVTVTGTSMVPSFHEGDRVLVVNDFNGVEQGDVVVIVNVLEEPIIKRVIATEGQTVDFDYEAGVVYVDGQPVDETQFGLENGITSEPFSSFELLEFPQTVPEGCVFVLGDNRAVSEDSQAAILVGVSTNRTISLTFAIGSGLAAVAAVMYCTAYPQVQPYMGTMLGLKAFIAAVLGGIGSIPGAMLGGVVIGLVESMTKGYISTRLADAVVFAILIIVLLVKPTGIMGKNVGEKV